MFLFKALLLVGLTFYADFFTLSVSTQDNIVDLGYVSYLGNQSFPNTNAFLGIPYAEPPLDEQRFRAPLPLNTTRITQMATGNVVDATEYPDFCVQGSTGAGDAGGAGSEDCLKVNVYAPVGAKKGSNFPVLFYIHGGGYVYGNPRNWPFDHWIHQSPNVVIVSVYYRLDSFGFMAVPEFNDPAVGDFNVGLRDQAQALKWVKQNIDAFGGDPQKVTINGQSAGGGSVELHIVTREDEQLFSGGIAQSVDRGPLPSPEQQMPLFSFYAAQAGCESGSVPTQLACLRKASISALARAQDAGSSSAFNGSYKSFGPVLDGVLITDFPTRSIISGNFAQVPLMVGATTDEGNPGSSIPSALKQLFPQLNDTDLDEFLEVYPSSDFTSESQRVQVATGESLLRCAREAMGGAFANHPKAWTYRYNQPNPTQGTSLVEHAAENWMMFLGTNTGFNGSTTFTPMTPIEISFAEELIAYWLSFVRAGDPNTYKLARSPTWAPYTTDTKTRVVLQQDPLNRTTHSGSFLEMEPEKESQRCQFVVSKVVHEQN